MSRHISHETSRNRALNYPSELLLNIFEESDWNIELRNTTHHLLNFYNRYNKILIVAKDPFDLQIARDIGANSIAVYSFIPRKSDRVVYINLKGYKLIQDDILALASLIKETRTLVALNLEYSGIEDEGIIELANVLRENINRTLVYLNLDNNYISDVGIRELAEALKQNDTLRYLSIYRIMIPIVDYGNAYLNKLKGVNRRISINLYFNLGDFDRMVNNYLKPKSNSTSLKELTNALANNSYLTRFS